MKIEFIGIGGNVHVQVDGMNVVFSASEFIDLVRWGIDHEVELRAKMQEADRTKKQSTSPPAC